MDHPGLFEERAALGDERRVADVVCGLDVVAQGAVQLLIVSPMVAVIAIPPYIVLFSETSASQSFSWANRSSSSVSPGEKR